MEVVVLAVRRAILLSSGVASMEQMEHLLPPDCRGPFLQIVHIRLDFWRGEGKLSHCLLGTDTGLSSLPGPPCSGLTNLGSAAG